MKDEIIAGIVSAIGGTAAALRGGADTLSYGTAPQIPEAKPQGIPTLKMPTARGWPDGQVPVAAPGLRVSAFARNLEHPRCLFVLPNGDVLVSEALGPSSKPKTVFDHAMHATMARAGAVGDSANRISLLRDADGDGVAEIRETFLDGLNHPFGMALAGDTFYVGNMDSVVAYPYTPGATRITGPGRTVMTMEGRGHWTRNLILSPDGTRLYVAVGSLSNIAERGMEVEAGRAAIHEIDLATGAVRMFASGLRNPVGMAWDPAGKLWTVVNERDGLGDETPPDYLTSVTEGGFYGWPYCYWGQTVDDRVPQDAAMVARAIQPDFALGGHTASLGLCWLPAGALPGFPAGMAIGQHGSWNRSKLSGYKLTFVPFVDGRPAGETRDILTGFLSDDENDSFGRPVMVQRAEDGSVLLADDVGNVVWRVTGA